MTDWEIIQACREYTMGGFGRAMQTLLAVEYIVNNGIAGQFIEIGVYRGGMVMMMLYKLQQLNTLRGVHLFDTFTGTTGPSEVDTHNGKEGTAEDICYPWQCSLAEVKANIARCGYPEELVRYHECDIREVRVLPVPIALLRLDTDWYDSTKAELAFEKLVTPGGIVVVDDYGWWDGCRKAVDEWLKDNPRAVNTLRDRNDEKDDRAIWWYKP